MEENKVTDSQVEKKISESVIEKDQPVIQDDKKTDNLIPQSRFNEVISTNKKLQEQIDSLNAKNAERKKAEMEKNGQYKELIAQQKEELRSLKELEIKYNAERQAKREKLLSSLPEDKREQYKDHPLNFLEDAVDVFAPSSTTAKVDTTAPLSNLGVSNKKDIFSADSKITQKDRKKNWMNIVEAFKK